VETLLNIRMLLQHVGLLADVLPFLIIVSSIQWIFIAARRLGRQGETYNASATRVAARVRALECFGGSLPFYEHSQEIEFLILVAVSKTKGEERLRRDIDAPPVFDGLIAANGRLHLVLENGSVQCWR
jgi:hypothetical protein